MRPALADPEPFERRFRAVLAADVVGYTRLMDAAELETHRRFRTLRVATIDPAIISFRGELVKNTGDGFIAVFETPLDAVRCAAEMQGEITAHEAGERRRQRLMFRMGIHWQPVLFDLKDVYGAGVNIASRLESVAQPGRVVVSAAIREQIGAESGLEFQDLGELRLRNIVRPVHAFAVQTSGLDATTAIRAAAQRRRP